MELSDDEVKKIYEECETMFSSGKLKEGIIDPNSMIANAYIEKGEYNKARKMLQEKMYKDVVDIHFACMFIMNSFRKEGKALNMIEKYQNLSIGLKKLFSTEGESPLGLSMDYLNYAFDSMRGNQAEKSVEFLKNMIGELKKQDINKNVDFKKVWCFNEIEVKKRSVTQNIYDNVFTLLEEKEFNTIRDSGDFKNVIKELQTMRKVYKR